MQKVNNVKPNKLKHAIPKTNDVRNPYSLLKAVWTVSLLEGCTDKIATIPALTANSSFSTYAIEIAKTAANIIFKEFIIISFIVFFIAFYILLF